MQPSACCFSLIPNDPVAACNRNPSAETWIVDYNRGRFTMDLRLQEMDCNGDGILHSRDSVREETASLLSFRAVPFSLALLVPGDGIPHSRDSVRKETASLLSLRAVPFFLALLAPAFLPLPAADLRCFEDSLQYCGLIQYPPTRTHNTQEGREHTLEQRLTLMQNRIKIISRPVHWHLDSA